MFTENINEFFSLWLQYLDSPKTEENKMKSSILNFKIIVLIIILQFATNGDAQSKGNETKKSVPADGNREEKCE